MRKSLILGTKSDVAKRKAKQVIVEPKPVRRIVTFNHPCIS